jgi:hypothetical protein
LVSSTASTVVLVIGLPESSDPERDLVHPFIPLARHERAMRAAILRSLRLIRIAEAISWRMHKCVSVARSGFF